MIQKEAIICLIFASYMPSHVIHMAIKAEDQDIVLLTPREGLGGRRWGKMGPAMDYCAKLIVWKQSLLFIQAVSKA